MDTFSKLWLTIKRLTKMKDSIVISIISGLIGTIVMDMSSVILWKTKKSELLHGHLAGSMFMRAFRTNKTKNFTLGQIFHMLTGATLGIPIFQLLKRTGKDHYIFKGGFVGLVTWGILYNFGQRVSLFMAKPHLTKTHYSSLLNNFLYGVTTAQTIVALADQSLFSEKKQSTLVKSSIINQTTSPWANLPDQQDPTYVEQPIGIH